MLAQAGGRVPVPGRTLCWLGWLRPVPKPLLCLVTADVHVLCVSVHKQSGFALHVCCRSGCLASLRACWVPACVVGVAGSVGIVFAAAAALARSRAGSITSRQVCQG